MKCPFAYLMAEEDQGDTIMKRVVSSLRKELETKWRTLYTTYRKIVTRQWVSLDGSPSNKSEEFNLFQGYVHKVLSDQEFAVWSDDTSLMAKVDKVHFHFHSILAAGSDEFNEYQLNWWSYVLRYGYKKVGTVLLYAGAEGSGKGIAVVDLMCNGIIGKRYCFICTDLKRFTGNFSAHREGKIAVVFNECMTTGNKKHADFDKIKAIITDHEFALERKGKEMYMAQESAAYVFISNWENCAVLGNGDRRYACSRMSDEKKGDGAYFGALASCIADKRVQRYWFNYLVRRDLSKWDRRNIPQTELRQTMKEDKNCNMLLTYLKLVVTRQQDSLWYNPELKGEHEHWYGCKRVTEGFKEWYAGVCGKNAHTVYAVKKVFKRGGPNWATNGKWKRRVTDRYRGDWGNEAPAQKYCYHITKETVRHLHRVTFTNPTWDYEEGETLRQRTKTL